METNWHLRRVAAESGRSAETVWTACRAGLLPPELLPPNPLPPEIGELLVTVFSARTSVRDLGRLIARDPEKARETLAALEQLAALSGAVESKGAAVA